MTYTFKLSRRLAVARIAPLGVLLLAAACATDSTEGLAPGDPGSDVTVSEVVLQPQQTVTEVGAPAQFVAYGRTTAGDSILLKTDVNYTASGGTIDRSGRFVASAPGTYTLVAHSNRGRKNKTDSSTVVVTPPATTLTAVRVSPETATLAPGAKQAFNATGSYSDGSSSAVSVTWSATGGTIDASGTYTAGNAAGTYHVIGKSASGPADTSTVTVQAPASPPPPPSSGTFKEPSGFTKVTERAWKALGETSGWEEPSNSNFAFASDANAPYSAPSIGRILFPKGFQGGSSPAFAEYTAPSDKRFKRAYFRYWLKVSDNWYGHQVQDKIGYAWIDGQPKMFSALVGGGNNPLKVQVRLQGLWKSSAQGDDLPTNLSSGAFSRGQWHLLEFVIVANTPGVANGEAHWWVDGVKVGAATDIGWVGSGSSADWSIFSWRPIWGGAGGTVPADQYMYMDHFYVSGAN